MNKPVREGFVSEEETDAPADVRPAVAKPAPANPVPDEPAPYVETWPIKVKILHKAIRDNNGAEIKELTFRQPTGADINYSGIPVRIDNAGEIVIDERKMTLMMTALSGVMTPFLEAMDPRDWASCAYRLRRFFLPDPAAW
jgi:hypothetical protein